MSEQILFNGRAQINKSSFRLLYSAGINIKAKPARVWALMTNAGDFSRWNSTVKSIEGTIASGQTIRLAATISPKRVFNLNIIEFDPEKKMVWSDGNALFKGVRTYILSSRPDSSSHYE